MSLNICHISQERMRLLSLKTVANILGVASRNIRRWIARGKLEAVRWPDGSWHVHEDEVRRLLRPQSLLQRQREGFSDE